MLKLMLRPDGKPRNRIISDSVSALKNIEQDDVDKMSCRGMCAGGGARHHLLGRAGGSHGEPLCGGDVPAEPSVTRKSVLCEHVQEGLCTSFSFPEM